ncbi:phosphatidate cytidylyltransferase [Sediminibacterium soli]|uniref:phosphatidate cytidylyltransferase n=1 Tax=Sediminibacterium soli TaxID=2698829 RepID=UPI00137ADA72|nr:phosphatidate cytidylyltransferase [Sediminibacterium soli]NCI47668.1 phosphatidate cytidylyltransferase [Sediminibacterium soli]
MALHLQTFRTRALSAIVFVAVMLAGLLWNQWSFLALFSLIHFGCWVEYQKLVTRIDPEYKYINAGHRYGVMLLGWGFMLWMTNADYRIGDYLLAAWGWELMWIGAIVFLLTVIIAPKFNHPKLLAHSLLGLLYLSLSWGLMMRLWNNMSQSVFTGRPWIMPVVLIASIWINDTMAYIVGSFIGRTPFSAISPKKTWEGTIGGALLAVAAVSLIGYYTCGFPVRALILISSVAAVFGTAGDLFESKLKRLAGVKDSGSIMPGHGGFLDRFDSLLFATTATWLLFTLL